jgi:UDP-2-acetamido-3-amino-2,3-dideoxy-glucuronate N-acetyltransferase
VHHYGLAKAALGAGKDVFVEKPLCLEADQAEELVSLAAIQNRILMVGHLLQYHPCVQRLQALVKQGGLGDLYYVTSNRLNLGKIRHEENALWSLAPHDISVVLSLVGDRLPQEVRCTGGAYLTDKVPDTTITTLCFAGGLRAQIYVSWLNPFKEQKLTVVGSRGMAVFDDMKPWPEKLQVFGDYLLRSEGQPPSPNKCAGEFVSVPEAEPLREECLHFLSSCAQRQTPRTDGLEGQRVLRVLNAAQASLDRNGERIDPIHPPMSTNDYYAHPSAVIDPGATIGRRSRIWHFAHISHGARVGDDCVFGQNTFVADGVVVGNNVKVQNNVAIYAGATIEDDVFLGPSCVLTNVTNPRSQVSRHSLYEKTLIRRGATVGANATIVCGVTLGRYCFVAAGAVLTKDASDYALMQGVPARQVGWMSRHGHQLKPDGAGELRCPESGFRYKEVSPGILRCLDLDEDSPLPKELSAGHRQYGDFKQSGS